MSYKDYTPNAQRRLEIGFKLKQKGLSFEAVAQQIGVSKQSVWKAADGSASLRIWQELANILQEPVYGVEPEQEAA
ncbi:helix-turn-helix domain-containing protein [bacterium]|nr:helix-turn-helix domain-containing protein [bacterium]